MFTELERLSAQLLAGETLASVAEGFVRVATAGERSVAFLRATDVARKAGNVVKSFVISCARFGDQVGARRTRAGVAAAQVAMPACELLVANAETNRHGCSTLKRRVQHRLSAAARDAFAHNHLAPPAVAQMVDRVAAVRAASEGLVTQRVANVRLGAVVATTEIGTANDVTLAFRTRLVRPARLRTCELLRSVLVTRNGSASSRAPAQLNHWSGAHNGRSSRDQATGKSVEMTAFQLNFF